MVAGSGRVDKAQSSLGAFSRDFGDSKAAPPDKTPTVSAMEEESPQDNPINAKSGDAIGNYSVIGDQSGDLKGAQEQSKPPSKPVAELESKPKQAPKQSPDHSQLNPKATETPVAAEVKPGVEEKPPDYSKAKLPLSKDKSSAHDSFAAFSSTNGNSSEGDSSINGDWRARIDAARGMLKAAILSEESSRPKRRRGEGKKSKGKRGGDANRRRAGLKREGVPKMRAWPAKAKIVRLLGKIREAHPVDPNLWVVLEVEPTKGTCSVVPLQSAGVFMRGANAGQTRYKVVRQKSAVDIPITDCDVIASQTVSHASSFLDKTWALMESIDDLR
ncbi:hypothetical protein AAMO2058_001130800 [Amorphochlora amoebiformis]